MNSMVKFYHNGKFFRFLLVSLCVLTHLAAVLLFFYQEDSSVYLKEHWSFSFYILTGLSCILSVFLNLNLKTGIKQILLLIIILVYLLLGYPMGADLGVEIVLGLNLIISCIFTFSDFYGEKIAVLITLLAVFTQKTYSLWNISVSGPSLDKMVFLVFIFFVFTLFVSLLKRSRNACFEEEKKNGKFNKALNELTNNTLDYDNLSRQNNLSMLNKEKKYITREIHDIVSYTMTNQLMLVQAAMSIKDKTDPLVENLLKKAQTEINQGMEKTRQSLAELRDKEAEEEDLACLLSSLVEKFKNFSNIKVVFEQNRSKFALPSEINRTVFHIVQQSMINTYLHSDAEKIEIVLRQNNDHLMVDIKDDGLFKKNFREGIGLKGMRERIEVVHGELLIESLKSGFHVSAEIPCCREGFYE